MSAATGSEKTIAVGVNKERVLTWDQNNMFVIIICHCNSNSTSSEVGQRVSSHSQLDLQSLSILCTPDDGDGVEDKEKITRLLGVSLRH